MALYADDTKIWRGIVISENHFISYKIKILYVLIVYLYFIVYYLFAHKRGTLLREFSHTIYLTR